VGRETMIMRFFSAALFIAVLSMSSAYAGELRHFESGCESFLHNEKFASFCFVSNDRLDEFDYTYIMKSLAEITYFEQVPERSIFLILKARVLRTWRYTVALMKPSGDIYAYGMGITLPIAMDQLYVGLKNPKGKKQK
jgi:hypothetical protein